jgi:hypothetical protein
MTSVNSECDISDTQQSSLMYRIVLRVVEDTPKSSSDDQSPHIMLYLVSKSLCLFVCLSVYLFVCCFFGWLAYCNVDLEMILCFSSQLHADDVNVVLTYCI